MIPIKNPTLWQAAIEIGPNKEIILDIEADDMGEAWAKAEEMIWPHEFITAIWSYEKEEKK